MVCMTLLDTKWQFYGESAIPLWMVLSGLLLCFVLASGWLRKENRRRSAAGRLLPVTLCLLLLLVSWRIYRPVAVKISTWRHEAQRLLYVDTSASMDLPVAVDANRSAALDVAQLYEPQALIGRPIAARRLGAELQKVATEAAAQWTALENIREQVLQGLPLGSESHNAVQRYKEWAQRAKTTLRQHVSELDAALDDLAARCQRHGSVRCKRELDHRVRGLGRDLDHRYSQHAEQHVGGPG